MALAGGEMFSLQHGDFAARMAQVKLRIQE